MNLVLLDDPNRASASACFLFARLPKLLFRERSIVGVGRALRVDTRFLEAFPSEFFELLFRVVLSPEGLLRAAHRVTDNEALPFERAQSAEDRAVLTLCDGIAAVENGGDDKCSRRS